MVDAAQNSKLNALVTQADESGQQQFVDVVPEKENQHGSPQQRRSFFASLCGCMRPKSSSGATGAGASETVPKKSSLKPSSVAPTTAEETVPAQGSSEGQLKPQSGKYIGRKTLVLDLDETLVHSSFRPINNPDIVITVEIEGEYHHVYVRKRPGVDEFLERLAPLFELVVYTASVSKYAIPLMEKLDPKGLVVSHLFREACTKTSGGYVKDLSLLGRDLKKVCIIDNSPKCYALQPDNAIPIRTWLEDPTDCELTDLIPILIALAGVDDIPAVLRQTLYNDEDEEESD